MTIIVALIYCHQHDRNLVPPDPKLSFIENVLLMMGFVEQSTQLPDPKVVKTLDSLWVLYCDHEMTNSTAAFLHVASTLADPISCCMAYVASGNGPLHGGAIDLAYKAFARLESPDRVSKMISDVKAKKHRLFGYGQLCKLSRANISPAQISVHSYGAHSRCLMDSMSEAARVAIELLR